MWVEAEIDDVLHHRYTLFRPPWVIRTEPFDKHLRLRAA
jgi:hypothetical protein